MSIDRKLPRPGVLKPGDLVTVVTKSPYRDVGTRLTPARVLKAARVWVDLEEVPDHPTAYPTMWRMRLDTQDDGSSFNLYGPYFRTAEQLEYEKRVDAAAAVVHRYFDTKYDNPLDTDVLFAVADLLTSLKAEEVEGG
jgi:hypothetical protein